MFVYIKIKQTKPEQDAGRKCKVTIQREKQTDGCDRQRIRGSGSVMRAERKCKMRGLLNGKRRG